MVRVILSGVVFSGDKFQRLVFSLYPDGSAGSVGLWHVGTDQHCGSGKFHFVDSLGTAVGFCADAGEIGAVFAVPLNDLAIDYDAGFHVGYGGGALALQQCGRWLFAAVVSNGGVVATVGLAVSCSQ